MFVHNDKKRVTRKRCINNGQHPTRQRLPCYLDFFPYKNILCIFNTLRMILINDVYQPRSVASMRVQLWTGRGRRQGAAARNKRERVPFLLDDNVGSIVSPCEVCAEPAELGLNESSCENHDSCG